MNKCIKCGGEDLNTTYRKAGGMVCSSSLEELNDEFLKSSEFDFYYKITAKKEHLHKHCRTCQYVWNEDTEENKLTKAIKE